MFAGLRLPLPTGTLLRSISTFPCLLAGVSGLTVTERAEAKGADLVVLALFYLDSSEEIGRLTNMKKRIGSHKLDIPIKMRN